MLNKSSFSNSKAVTDSQLLCLMTQVMQVQFRDYRSHYRSQEGHPEN